LPQQSVAFHVAVITCRHGGVVFVVTLTRPTTTLEQQASVAVGGVSVQVDPQGRLRFVAQVMTGGTVSTTWMICVQLVALPQQSVMTQVRRISMGQLTKVFVESGSGVIVMLAAGQQRSVAIGGVKTNGWPHWMTALLAQTTIGGRVSCSITRWLHTATFEQQSVAVQNRS
jgi:hypothetical protein